MSERSGLSDLDVALLQSLARCGAWPDGPHTKSARVLQQLHADTGIPPDYGYRVMCDLAAPWLVHLSVLDPTGTSVAAGSSASAQSR